MTSVCFTGRGANRNGAFCGRIILEDEARRAGWTVHDKVGFNTTYLVASRSDTTKARTAQRQGTTILSYAGFWQLMDQSYQQRTGLAKREEVTSRTISDDIAATNRLPKAQTAPLNPEMQEHNLEVWRVLCRAPGPNSSLRPIETDSKAQTFEDVEAETTWDDIYALLDNHRDHLLLYLPIISTQQAGLPRNCSPFDGFGPVFDATEMKCFILRRHDADYFVNTEGYSYCRYVARIKPFNGPTNSSIEPARIPGRRYVVLDEEA